jgi:hypothetical protein
VAVVWPGVIYGMAYSQVVIKNKPPKVTFKKFTDDKVGYAYPTEYKIEVATNQSNREIIGSTLHECLHLTLPSLTEAAIAPVLWKAVLKLKNKWSKANVKKRK